MKNTEAQSGPSDAYWRRYFDTATAARAAGLVEVLRVASTGVELHVDHYPQAAADAPVVVLIHGGGGYGGLFAGLALAFHARGYRVLVPDQRGQGRSGGRRGDFTVAEAVANVVDTVEAVRARFAGPVFLAGGSIGGGLAYQAGAVLARAGRAPSAVLCLDLYDFGDPRTALEFTRFARLARVPGLAYVLRAATAGLAALVPGLTLPYRPLARFDEMLDRRDRDAYRLWRDDPFTPRKVTARYFASVMASPAAIPFEANRDLAVLVVNQRRDRMVRPAVTRAAARRLAGPVRYVEIDWGHFSLLDAFSQELAGLGDDWFRVHGAFPKQETAA